VPVKKKVAAVQRVPAGPEAAPTKAPPTTKAPASDPYADQK
jgi:hypothetical protein